MFKWIYKHIIKKVFLKEEDFHIFTRIINKEDNGVTKTYLLIQIEVFGMVIIREEIKL